MRKLLRALGALAVFLGAAASQAAVVYGDRTAFEAALGSSLTDDYEAAGYQAGDRSDSASVDIHTDGYMSGVLGQTKYTTTGFPQWNLIHEAAAVGINMSGRVYCAGCNGSFVLDFTSTGYGDASGVFGVGFDFFNASSLVYTAYVTYGDGSSENILLDAAPRTAPDFFGLTSASGIASIALGLPDGGATMGGLFGIDRLTIGSAAVQAVPEPASGLLAATLLAALPLARRRRR